MYNLIKKKISKMIKKTNEYNFSFETTVTSNYVTTIFITTMIALKYFSCTLVVVVVYQ